MAGLFGSKGDAAPSAGFDGAAGPDRRKLILGGVAGLAIVALLALVVLPMLSGGSSDSASAPLVSPRRSAAAGVVTPSPSVTPSDNFTLAPAAAYGDPFAPLPEESAAAAAAAATASAVPTVGAATASTAADPTSVAGSTTGATTTGGTTASRSAATSSTTNNTPASGKPVQVMTVKGTSADIQIDSKAYTVSAGQTPVVGYTVKSLGSGKVTFTRNGTAHTLAEGELQTF